MNNIFGGNTPWTYEQLQSKRKIAEELLVQNSRTPRNVGEGLHAVGRALAARGMEKRANRRETELKDDFDAQLSGLFGGGSIGGPTSDVTSQTSPSAATGDWLQYDNQAAVRNKPLSEKLVTSMSFLGDMGIQARVVSGGQSEAGKGPRTGSTRHDHGHAADVDFYKDGRKLDWNNPEDIPIFQEIVRRGRQSGLTGFGAGNDYMGAGRMHLGFGTEAAWGAGGKGANAPAWLREAYNGAPSSAPSAASVTQSSSLADMVKLSQLMDNPMATSGQKAVLGALMQRQMDASKPVDPLRQLQIQKITQELNQTPDRKVIEGADGFKYYQDSGERVLPGVETSPEFEIVTPEEVKALNLPDGSYQRGSDGKIHSIGKAGTSVTVNNNPLAPETAAPRDSGQLAKKLSDADASMITEARVLAQSAGDIESLAGQLEQVVGRVGYTGPGGEVYGKIDDAIGVLPGDSGARGAFRSMAMEAQLAFTEKTKGAITDREMGMFKTAVPNLTQRKEGNEQIIQVMRAGAARVQARAEFLERYAQQNGSLENAQAAWNRYMDENPILTTTGDSLTVSDPAPFDKYLSREVPTASGNLVSEMSRDEFMQSPEAKSAADRAGISLEDFWEFLEGRR